MCTPPSNYAQWLLVACAVSATSFGQKAPNPAKSKKDKLAIQLPDAYSGVPYNNKSTGALRLATGPLHCTDPTPALPNGNSFTCTSELTLGGTPTTSTEVLVHSAVTVTDILGQVVELDLNFTMRPAAETVIVGGPKPKPAPPVPINSRAEIEKQWSRIKGSAYRDVLLNDVGDTYRYLMDTSVDGGFGRDYLCPLSSYTD
jgi:hypothetical protein